MSTAVIERTKIKLENDAKITLTIAGSRRATEWLRREVTLAQLYTKLANPIRTAETMIEYAKMDKEHQIEIKDVGGYVGGTFRGTKRLADQVDTRTLVVLDGDFILSVEHIWSMFRYMFNFNSFLHTTHSYTAESQRVRLIIPFTRPTTVEEYTFISEKIAELLGNDKFDPTTHETNRMMFWPSVSTDGEFRYLTNDTPLLDPDIFLADYPGWNHCKTAMSTKKEKSGVSNSNGTYEWMRDMYQDGTRTRALTGLIGTLVAHGVDTQLAWQLVDAYNQSYFSPPLGEEKLKHTFKSILRRELKRYE